MNNLPKKLAHLAAFAAQVSSINLGELIEKTLPTVNELLPGSTPMGAYSLGLICALAWSEAIEPPRSLLELAATCESVEQASGLYREFRELRGL